MKVILDLYLIFVFKESYNVKKLMFLKLIMKLLNSFPKYTTNRKLKVII